MRFAVSLALLLCILSLTVAVAAKPARPAGLETSVVRVALFKNGLGFFVREGRLPVGTHFTMATPVTPAHGTFWLSYPKDVVVKALVSREVEAQVQQPVVSMADLLTANVGREVTVTPMGEGTEPVTGRLLAVTAPEAASAPDPYAWGRQPAEPRYPQPARLALVASPAGTSAIEVGTIRQVTVAGGPAVMTLGRKAKRWELSCELAEPAAGKPVSASYLAKGITWAPSYVIDISDPKQARLSAKAEVINEAEDLQEVKVELITGFPNLRFADICDPLAGRETLGGFLGSLARGSSSSGQRGDITSNVMTQSAMYAPAAAPPPIMPDYGAGVSGKAVEDLFFYPLKGVTLGKWQTGYYPLFTAAVAYEQIYQWEIPDFVNQEDRYGGREQEQRDRQEEVWHSIRLTNQGKMPWTTAPAQVVKEGRVLGQEVLDYTPAGAATTMRITRALGVKAEQAEYESNRERGAVQLYGWEYDRITVDGKMRVVNLKAEPITLEVVKNLSGEVKQTSPEAKVQRLSRGLRRMNPLHVLTWHLTLKPGEEKELAYTYVALIRNR